MKNPGHALAQNAPLIGAYVVIYCRIIRLYPANWEFTSQDTVSIPTVILVIILRICVHRKCRVDEKRREEKEQFY